jgi:hypothetical protein
MGVKLPAPAADWKRAGPILPYQGEGEREVSGRVFCPARLHDPPEEVVKELSMPETGVQRAARGVSRSDWFERLARAGFAAKGVVYVLIAVLSAGAAFSAGRAEGSEGALVSLHNQPFGRILLGLVAIGLVGYAVFRFVSALANPEGEGLVKRVGHAGKALVYAALAVGAARLALQAGAASAGAERATHWTAEVMARPLGVLAIGIAGLVTALYGLYQIHKGATGRVLKDLDTRSLSSRGIDWVSRLGRAGLAARGVVLIIIGAFLALAALRSDPSEARGLGGALRTVEQQAYGPWLLALIATGLLAYGLFQFVHARYRRIGHA